MRKKYIKRLAQKILMGESVSTYPISEVEEALAILCAPHPPSKHLPAPLKKPTVALPPATKVEKKRFPKKEEKPSAMKRSMDWPTQE